jgi:Holliday junction resolvase RusA-like endonuclease
MSKRKMTVHFRIPPYEPPRNDWRKNIYKAAKDEIERRGIQYDRDDKLQICIVLYLPKRSLEIHDLDNRSKDVLDALQGRMGGSKAMPTKTPLVPNDNQFASLSVTKSVPPKQSLQNGHVTISKFRPKK